MSATTPTITLRDMVPAESVDDLIDAVRAGLDHLHLQLEQAEQGARHAEEQLIALQVAPDGDPDRIDHLYTSIEELSAGGSDYFRKEIEAAGAEAAARLAEARAHAGWLLVEARQEVATRLAVSGDEAAAQALVPTSAALFTPLAVTNPADLALAVETEPAPVPDADLERETEQFQEFWKPEQEITALSESGRVTSTAIVPVVTAAMAALVLLVVVAALAWIG